MTRSASFAARTLLSGCRKPIRSRRQPRMLALIASIFTSCLLSLALTSPSYAQNEANLSWVAPSQNTDGTALTDLAGYWIWSGCEQTGQYEIGPALIADPSATAHTVPGLPDGTCYFAATAFNSEGVESNYSNEATKTFIADLEPPGVTTVEIEWTESVMVATVQNSPGFITNSGGTSAGDRTDSHTFNYDHDDSGTTLIIGVLVDDTSTAGVSSLTYDGSSATELYSTGDVNGGKSNERHITVFRVDSPPSGISEIVITGDGSNSQFIEVIYSLTDAGSITVADIEENTQTDGTTVNFNISPTTTDGIVFRFDRWWSSSGSVSSSTGTQIDDQGVNSQDSRGGALFVGGSATDTDTQVVWSTSTNHYLSVGLFVPDAAGGTTVEADSATHGHTADNVVLSQANILGVQSASHGHTVDGVVLTQEHNLDVADADHAQAADSVALTQANVLAPAAALHAHAADNVDLTQQNLLAVQSAVHDHAAGNITLQVAGALDVQSALHGHTADSVGLSQAHQLGVDDASHTQLADTVELSTGLIIDVADALHQHGVDNVTLSQAHILAVAEALHAQSAANITLQQGSVMAVDDALHAHSADAVGLTVGNLLAVASTVHVQQADTLALTQAHTLVVSSSLHQHLADHISLRIPGFVNKPGRVFVVETKNRTFVVARGNRTFQA